MLLRRFSQTIRVSIAMIVAIFSTGLLPTAVAFAEEPELQTVQNQGQETCPNTTFTTSAGGWVKYDGLSSTAFEVPQKQGFTVTQLCYKASTEVMYPAVSGTVTSTVTNKNGQVQNLSHVSVYYTPVAPTPVTAGVVTYVDLCGTANDTFTVPTTPNVTYSVASGTHAGVGAVTVTATANTGYVLTAPYTFSYTFTNDACETPLIPVTAGTVTYADICGTANDTYTVPTTPNVTYSVAAGTHAGVGTVTVTATANTGYVLTAPYTFTHTFTNEACNPGQGGGDKVDICHRTNSVTNPYTRNNVAVSSVDGDTGNDNGQGDHFAEHTGPVFDPNTTYPTPHNGDQWGDIIPPVAGHSGLNWSTEGQAIYNNNCNVPAPQRAANIVATVVCVPTGVKVTLTNSGNASGNATVNGTMHTVAAGATKEVVLSFDAGTPFMAVVTITIGNNTTTQTVNCAPGQGGGQTLGSTTTKTPTTPQVLGTTTELPAALPSTGSEQNPMLILLASLMAYGIAYLFQGRRQLTQNRA